jgi:hypothetical protein
MVKKMLKKAKKSKKVKKQERILPAHRNPLKKIFINARID